MARQVIFPDINYVGVPLFGAEDAAISPTQMRSLPARASLRRTWVPASRVWGAMTAAQFTLSNQFGLETDYDLIRLVYSQPTVVDWVIVLACISPSAATGDQHSPVNSANRQDFTMFQNVYFNNAGADVAPQDQLTWGSGTRTLTITGASGSTTIPPRWYSDWMRMSSIPRIDGGTTPLLMTRHLSDAAGTYKSVAITNFAAWDAIAQGRNFAAWHKQGVDSVTTPALLVTPQKLGFSTPDGVQYMSRVPGVTVLGVGDSLTQGFGSSTSYHGWGYLSCLALSTPGRPISYFNQGWQGSLSSDFWSNGYNAFKCCKPDIVTIATYSPNDGTSQAVADAAWSRAMDFAHYVMQNGAVPVLMGPLPWGSLTTVAQDAVRRSTRTKLLQAGAYGMNILDWEEAIGTGANPNRIRPEFLSGDALHPNDAGYNYMDGAVFRPVLRQLVK